MALALRIDEWINQEGGGIEVRYTYGNTPLPASWSGFSLNFPGGAAEMNDLITHVENTCIQPDLMLGMLAARFRRQSADYSNPNQIRGRAFTYNPDTPGIIQIN